MIKEYKKELTRSSINLILITTLTSILIAVVEFISPFLIKNFIGNYKTYTTILVPLTIIGCTYLLCYVFKIVLNRIINVYSVKFKTEETCKLYNLMFKMKYSKLNTLEPTYLVEKITNSVNVLFSLYSEAIATIIIAIFTIIGCVLSMIFINKIIALIFLLVIPLQYFSYKKLNKKLSNMCIGLQTTCAKNFMNIISITSKVDYIKQSYDATKITKILKTHVKNIHKANSKVNNFAGLVSISLLDIINNISSGIYIYTSINVLLNNMDFSEFVFVNLIISLFFPALNKIIRANINLRDLEGIYNFVEKEILENLEEDGLIEVNNIAKIEYHVQNLSYDDLSLIENGELIAVPGDIILIKGQSGCGKTTLMKGLVKFFNINNIKINGIPISDYTNASIRNKISFFSQNIPIIPGSIKDNILMCNNDKVETLELLKTKPFMQKFFANPDGLDAKILENGSNLSGGDKQKISLTRIYFENPDVIILDEITSSIDKESAEIIIEDIIKTHNGKIIFMISHDDHVKKYCNKVFQIKDKKLLEVIS